MCKVCDAKRQEELPELLRWLDGRNAVLLGSGDKSHRREVVAWETLDRTIKRLLLDFARTLSAAVERADLLEGFLTNAVAQVIAAKGQIVQLDLNTPEGQAELQRIIKRNLGT
jgi:hypothetical protein